MASLFYVDWDAIHCELVRQSLAAAGHRVECESEDGAQAWKRIRDTPPELLVVSLTRQPSHGRQTARAVSDHKSLKAVKLLFVDGSDKAVSDTRRAFPSAVFTSSDRLLGEVDALTAK